MSSFTAVNEDNDDKQGHTHEDNSSSDDDCFIPSMNKPVKAKITKILLHDKTPSNDTAASSLSDVTILDHLFLLRDKEGILLLLEEMIPIDSSSSSDGNSCNLLVANVAIDILSGKHMKIVTDLNGESHPLSLHSLLPICQSSFDSDDSNSTYDQIRSVVTSYIYNTSSDSFASDSAGQWKAMHCLLIAITYLEIYCQINYTGPELPQKMLDVLSSTGTDASIENNDVEISHRKYLQSLEIDGEYAFPVCQAPQLLLVARCILSLLADLEKQSWKLGIYLNDAGEVLTVKAPYNNVQVIESLRCVSSRHWHNSRSIKIHLRLLLKQSHEAIPTLWKESKDMFTHVLQLYGGTSLTTDEMTSRKHQQQQQQMTSNIKIDKYQIWYPNSRNISATIKDKCMRGSLMLATQAWLEWGLCCHHFEYGDRGKQYFSIAKYVSGLSTTLTAAMGKRTKYQQHEHSQLYLIAKSALINDSDTSNSSSSSIKSTGTVSQYKLADKPVDLEEVEYRKNNPDSWQHAEYELGRRLVGEVEGTGEEAAVREVMLDSQDGGAAENILLEGGPKFTDTGIDKGGRLHPVDQAVILSLCLDVSNHNPADGLTYEEMFPYIERVLMQAENWMIHSTALLERSWLEFEKRKTMDRAMLQIQALLDQHTTKLTISQSTYKSIEDSAPAQDRLRYMHCIIYPSQYELKRDLASRYLTATVFVSALNLFRELQMWDEVVTCYQLLEKPHRAEIVVREQLKKGETPYMLTALGDLTSSIEYYERAWKLSNHRYVRAKRTLARVYFDKNDFHTCCKHLDEALAIQPLVPTAWYLKGIACMRIEYWEEGIQAFSRCVQQDIEIGEAWGNMGAIYMKMRMYEKAYPSLHEALKHKRDSWRLIENLVYCCLTLGKFQEVISHMNRLLDLREKSKRPIHKDEIRMLIKYITEDVRIYAKECTGNDKSDSDFNQISNVCRQLEVLLVRITNTVKNEPEIWEICAEFYRRLKKHRPMMDCIIKQFRATITQTNWEKELTTIDVAIACAQTLVDSHVMLHDVTKEELYACRSMLQTCLKGIETVYKTSDQYAVIEGLIARVTESYSK